MKNINKDKLNSIVKSLMINPREDVLKGILEDWSEIQKHIENLKKIDTTNVEPLRHVNEELRVDFLREDIVDKSWAIKKQQFLKNAKEADNDYILTKKVVE